MFPAIRIGTYIFIIAVLSFISCINDKANYYSMSESNFHIVQAFVLKDGLCGVTHGQISIIRGSSLKRDIDRCVNDIYLVDCSLWTGPDPAPMTCRIIEYK